MTMSTELGPKVVIADDSQADRDLATRLFHGVRLLAVENAEQALEVIDEDVTIVLSDYRMPEHDGVWLLDQVARQDVRARRFLMTNYPDNRCAAALKDGIVERIFIKPVTLQALRAALSDA